MNRGQKQPVIATVVSEDFLFGYLVMITSLIRENPWFDLPVRVIYDDDKSQLSEQAKELILGAWHKTELIKVNKDRYQNIDSQRDGYLATPKRLHAAFLILEAFSFDDAQRVICVDSDMICMGDISELLRLDLDFGVCQAIDWNTDEEFPYFNTGLMVIGERHLGQGTYQELLELSIGEDYNRSYGKADQAVLNCYFQDKPYVKLDWVYNVSKRHYEDPQTDLIGHLRSQNVKFFHYVGQKPWNLKTTESELGYQAAEALWEDEFSYISTVESLHLLIEQKLRAAAESLISSNTSLRAAKTEQRELNKLVRKARRDNDKSIELLRAEEKNTRYLKRVVERKEEEIRQKNQQIVALQTRLAEIEQWGELLVHSKSFRLGSLMLTPARMLKKAISRPL